MPIRIIPKGKPDFSDLTPTQVRVSNVFEVGGKFQGNLGELVSTACESCQKCHGCESCQKCEGCQSCQKSDIALVLDQEIGIDALNGSPVKIAREVTYELAKDPDPNKDAFSIVKSKLIVEMSPEDFKRLPNKEKFVEIGTSQSGLKKYQIETKE